MLFIPPCLLEEPSVVGTRREPAFGAWGGGKVGSMCSPTTRGENMKSVEICDYCREIRLNSRTIQPQQQSR